MPQFDRIEARAEKLMIAAMEREQMDGTTAEAKMTLLACFWLAANFETVSAALAHTYGDEDFPVGESFEDFAKSFLGEERFNEIVGIELDD